MEILKKPRLPRILYYDIETTDLNADWGEILMVAWKWEGSNEVHCRAITDYPNWEKEDIDRRDVPLIKEFCKVLEQADVIIGHYADKFDYRFIQTRSIFHGMGPIPKVPMIDTWKIAKYQLKFTSNRLANLADYLEVPEQKGKVSKKIWRQAQAHHPAAIEQLRDYCMQDVKTLQAVFRKLLPLAEQMPNMQLLFNTEEECCPHCGSNAVQKRGLRFAKANVYQRYQCTSCKAWSRGARALPKPVKKIHIV